ncbi:hypothetical protein RchiOBHm_Chr2g0144151 [Rosa chinensis]|uniref:Uncharacterized protein n=1 Tax=Rosa chinensis TaxID=74649 RepID=A0A2P6RYB5_ROSCH|nr:hypothetical protein RchiOBHm_Chr2g0144151 [Rosa chinensis]
MRNSLEVSKRKVNEHVSSCKLKCEKSNSYYKRGKSKLKRGKSEIKRGKSVLWRLIQVK